MKPKRVVFLLIIFCLHLNAQPTHFYFGNLHAHTGFSDGNKDSLSSLIARPDASYNYAKLSKDFDFLGISEHNHYSSAHNPGFLKPLYQTGLNMADVANEEGTFLALYGMEYGVSSQYNGHVIIYGFNELIGWENSVPGISGVNYDIYNAKTDYDALFRKVKNKPEAFCYLAHPDFTDFSTDGTYATSLASAPYNAAYDSAIVGMPLRSGLANSTSITYDDYSLGNYFNYYKRLLYLGYHLGIGYDHDNHYSNFGRSNGGRLVIVAPHLTRADLVDAMKQMHFYGSDDANAKLIFSLNNHVMGSICSGSSYPQINIVHDDPDGESADTIKVWKGRKNSGGWWAEIVSQGLHTDTHSFTDTDLKTGYEYFYFCEIRQSDGHWMVSSPIWYTPVAPLKNTLWQEEILSCYYNPVSAALSLSLPYNSSVYRMRLYSVAGDLVYDTIISGKDIKLYLGQINPGLYILELSNQTTRLLKKLMIE